MLRRLVKAAMVFLMWYPLRWLIHLAPAALVDRLGRLGGGLLWRLSGRQRAALEQEFGRVFPARGPADRRALARASFTIFCLAELEVLLYPRLTPELIRRRVAFEHLDCLDAALARGKGVLLFQAHFGAFQMTLPAIGFLGYPLNQLSASAAVWKGADPSRLRDRSLDLKARLERGLPVRHLDVHGSLRPVYRALARNEIVGIAVDGGGGRAPVRMPFLGRTAAIQAGAAELAVRTGAAVVPAFLLTEPGLRHRLVLHPPPAIPPDAAPEEQRDLILRAFLQLLESYVLRFPAHYGYTLCLRRLRANLDRHPFFDDYEAGPPRAPGEIQ